MSTPGPQSACSAFSSLPVQHNCWDWWRALYVLPNRAGPSHLSVSQRCGITPLAHISPNNLVWPLPSSYQRPHGLMLGWYEAQNQVYQHVPATGCTADTGPGSAAGVALAGAIAAFSSARA